MERRSSEFCVSEGHAGMSDVCARLCWNMLENVLEECGRWVCVYVLRERVHLLRECVHVG